MIADDFDSIREKLEELKRPGEIRFSFSVKLGRLKFPIGQIRDIIRILPGIDSTGSGDVDSSDSDDQ